MATALDARQYLSQFQNAEKARFLQGFFKTGPGQYAEGDVLWGISVPQTRKVAKIFAGLSLEEISVLLQDSIHECRLMALLILVNSWKKAADQNKRKELCNFYLVHTKWINNWDLVDLSAPDIVGGSLFPKYPKELEQLAHSHSLWERRIAIVATFYYLKNGVSEPTTNIAKLLLHDAHDLIHKAVGWMLREMGKRVSRDELRTFLDQYAKKMPRTMLRYSIEHFSEDERQYYLKRA